MQYTVIGYYDAEDFNLGGMVYRATVEAGDQWGAFEKVAALGIQNLVLVCAVEGVQEIHTATENGETCAAQDYPGWPAEVDA